MDVFVINMKTIPKTRSGGHGLSEWLPFCLAEPVSVPFSNIFVCFSKFSNYLFTFAPAMKKIIMITGGQRSGKSVEAERMALSLCQNPVYLATAHIWDDEFRQRVVRHQERRGPQWTNIEEEKWLSRHDVAGRVVVIDCITLWCTNFFYDRTVNEWEQPSVDEALAKLKQEFDLFTRQDATFIFVTNEIGSGGVSESAVQRRFTDLEGWMNQYVASRADEVILMVSGIAVRIKPQPGS